MTEHAWPEGPRARFEIGEIVELKGLVFKVVLVDVFAGKIGLKFAPAEARSAPASGAAPAPGGRSGPML